MKHGMCHLNEYSTDSIDAIAYYFYTLNIKNKMEENKIEEKEMLQDAVNEITALRTQNKIQQARLSMFDDMMLLLRTPPSYGASNGWSPDIVSKMEQRISALKKTPDMGDKLPTVE